MQKVNIKQKWVPYLLIIPTILLIAIFKIYPMVDSLRQSLVTSSGVSLDNYRLLFLDKTFWNSVWITVKFNLMIIPIQVVISFIMSLMVNMRIRGVKLFRTIIYLPFCVSLTISTVIWQMILNINGGVVNSFLSTLGLPKVGFLIDPKYALLSIILICSWRGCAYWMMFFLAGLKGIDDTVYEAAAIDGAGFWSSLFRITIPMLKNTILFVLVANTTANFLLFAPVQIATRGGPQDSTNVLMYEAYKSAFSYSNRTRMACIVTILLMIILIVCILQNKFLTSKDRSV